MQTTPMGYYSADACALDDFTQLVQQSVDPSDVPHADEVLKNIPVYDMAKLATLLGTSDGRRALMAEWARVLHSGAGVFVQRNAYADTSAIDAATAIFERIIAQALIQHRTKHNSMAEVTTELHRGKRTQPHTRILEFIANDFRQFATTLFRHALATGKFSRHFLNQYQCCFRCKEMISAIPDKVKMIAEAECTHQHMSIPE